jgi:hypothetical protein
MFIRRLPALSSAGDELTRECAYHPGSGRSSPRIRQATEFVQRLGHDLQDESGPIEVCSRGRTHLRWKQQICAWRSSPVSNGPTEAATTSSSG